MSDTTLNQFVASGTAAERVAFTPTPPTPAAAPDNGYFWFETDTGLTYSWDGAVWVQTGGGGATSVTAAGTLTANRIVLGAGAKAVTIVGSLGTTTTVLHGNAAGAPTFGAVVLTTDVSGVLPVANGGTGVSASFSARLMTEVTLTNAQVIALPTTPFQLVAAPAAGTYIEYEKVVLITKFAGGAYTGAAAVSSIQASVSGVGFTTLIPKDNTTTPNLTALTRFLSAASLKTILYPYLGSVAEASGDDYVLTSLADGTNGIDTMATFSGGNMSLFANNGGVDFGGGNAANTLIARVYYTLNSVP